AVAKRSGLDTVDEGLQLGIDPLHALHVLQATRLDELSLEAHETRLLLLELARDLLPEQPVSRTSVILVEISLEARQLAHQILKRALLFGDLLIKVWHRA